MPLTAHAQVRPVWTNRYDNALPAKTNTPLGIAIDPSGNILVAGSSVNTNNDWDYFVLKYAANGAPLWTNRYDSGSNDLARGFVLDNAGNTLITGTSQSVKVGANGDLLWVAPYAGRGIAADTNGNVLVTGFSSVDFATAKLHGPSGTNLWTKYYDKINKTDFSEAVTVDDDGNVYVAGNAQRFCDLLTCFYSLTAVKYDSGGSQLWVRDRLNPNQIGYVPAEIRGLAVDRARSLLYVFANHRDDGFLFITAQITLAGQTNWTTYQWGSSAEGERAFALDHNGGAYLTGSRIRQNPDVVFTTFKINDSSQNESPVWGVDFGPHPGYSRANAVAVDSANNAYIAGLSPGATSGQDFVTISYDPNGSQRWLERWSSGGNTTDEATGIAVDSGGNVYVTGYSTTPQGGTEIVTIKYAPTPPPVQIKSNGSALLQLPRPAGQPFSVESSTNLFFWQPLGLATTDVTGLLTFEDTNAPAYSARFYRTVPP